MFALMVQKYWTFCFPAISKHPVFVFHFCVWLMFPPLSGLRGLKRCWRSSWQRFANWSRMTLCWKTWRKTLQYVFVSLTHLFVKHTYSHCITLIRWKQEVIKKKCRILYIKLICSSFHLLGVSLLPCRCTGKSRVWHSILTRNKKTGGEI